MWVRAGGGTDRSRREAQLSLFPLADTVGVFWFLLFFVLFYFRFFFSTSVPVVDLLLGGCRTRSEGVLFIGLCQKREKGLPGVVISSTGHGNTTPQGKMKRGDGNWRERLH